MNSNFCILISQVWLTQDRMEFREQLELSVEYCRLLNPNEYIIISGMGPIKPTKKTIDLCDKLIWEDEVSEVVGNGFPKMISRGLQHAKDKKYKHVFKFRGDAIILNKKCAEECLSVINSENKDLLITQESAYKFFDGRTMHNHYWVGDMVLLGKTDLLLEMFNPDSWVTHLNGMVVSGNYSLGLNLIKCRNCGEGENWISFLRKNCSFRDAPFFRWVDLRHNYKEIDIFKNLLEELKSTGSFRDSFDLSKYFWGVSHGAHKFDEFGNGIPAGDWIYKKEFYDEVQ